MAWKSLDEIELWQMSRTVCTDVWKLCNSSVVTTDPGIRQQMLNSSGSIMDNIAEGFGRGSNGEFRTFLGYAKGSCTELLSQIVRLHDRGSLNDLAFSQMHENLTVLNKRSTKLIQTLRDGE